MGCKWRRNDTRRKKEVLENLPEEVDIPDGMWDEDEIADWLSEEFGFCYYGFELVD